MPKRLTRADHAARSRRAEWRAHNAGLAARVSDLRASADDFLRLRRYMLNMNRAQAARVLRVDHDSIYNWETGKHRLPFPVYLALHLLHESVAYKFADEAWRDWRIVQRYDTPRRNVGLPGDVSEITNAKLGAAFTPADLEHFHFAMQEVEILQAQNAELRNKVDALTAENAEIRELFRVNGVTDELHQMHDRVETLLGKLNIAKVIRLERQKQAA